MSQPVLHVVTTSTRPGRIGPVVSDWFTQAAQAHGAFDVRPIDLADFDLPVFDEPKHPAMRQYAHEHTKRWSASVAQADAYAFVLPEYNYCPPPSFVNALDYLVHEWKYKPCGFVSYGGLSGGLRAVQAAKLLVTTLNMMPLPEGVALPMVQSLLNAQRQLQSNPLIDQSVQTLLDALQRWAVALKPMRG